MQLSLDIQRIGLLSRSSQFLEGVLAAWLANCHAFRVYFASAISRRNERKKSWFSFPPSSSTRRKTRIPLEDMQRICENNVSVSNQAHSEQSKVILTHFCLPVWQ